MSFVANDLNRVVSYCRSSHRYERERPIFITEEFVPLDQPAEVSPLRMGEMADAYRQILAAVVRAGPTLPQVKATISRDGIPLATWTLALTGPHRPRPAGEAGIETL